jgi:hypothetical protein
MKGEMKGEKLETNISVKQKTLTLLKYTVAAAAALFVFSFPFVNKFSIIVLWVLIVAAVANFAAHRKFNFKAIYIFPLALFALRMASLSFAPPDVTFKSVEYCLSLLLIPALFSLFRLSQAQVQWFLRYVFYALLLAVALAWLVFMKYILSSEQTLLEVFKNPKAYNSLFLGPLLFWQPSFIAVAISVIIPVSFYLWAHKRIKPLLMWMAIVLSVAFIFVLGARIGIVVSGFLLLLSLIYYYKHISRSAKAGMLLLILATALYARSSPYSITSDPVRKHLRALGMSAIAEKPVFGSGVYSMHRYIASEGTYEFNHFHNTFIDETVQFGAVGGILLTAFFAYLIVLAFRKRDFLLMAFLAIYLPFACVESLFMSVKGVMPFMFWFCFLVSTQDERKIALTSKDRPKNLPKANP